METKQTLKAFIIGKKGNAFFPVRAEDVLLIVYQSGVRFAIDNAVGSEIGFAPFESVIYGFQTLPLVLPAFSPFTNFIS